MWPFCWGLNVYTETLWCHVSQDLTVTRKPPSTSRFSSRTSTSARKPKKSTPTSPVPPTPTMCSSYSMPSPTSSSKTISRIAGSSNQEVGRCFSRVPQVVHSALSWPVWYFIVLWRPGVSFQTLVTITLLTGHCCNDWLISQCTIQDRNM